MIYLCVKEYYNMVFLLYKNMLEGVTLYIQIFGDLTLLFVLNLNNPILGL